MEDKEGTTQQTGISRRQLVAGFGGIALGAAFAAPIVQMFILPDDVIAFAASEGYLLVDRKKCQGCNTCMMACSLAHHGVQSLSLARIQVTQDPFAAFPNDRQIDQCRQCPGAPCVSVCPTGANHIDAGNGNVRTIDRRKCIGCQACVAACPFNLSRAIWNGDEKHAQKCDLCADTPFWDKPVGEQACRAVCPTGAISFTEEIPIQTDAGYEVNLRGENWAALGFPID